MALGILDDDMFDANVETYAIPEKGFMFLCSDGLLEEQSPSGECFSNSRLLKIIESNPPDLVGSLVEALRIHTNSTAYRDDVSICAIAPAALTRGACKFESAASSALIAEEKITDFVWAIKLTGSQLSTIEVAPLANRFLQGIGVNQNTCQVIFSVLSEMLSNAIDHGLLGLDSKLKEDPEGFHQYYCRREAGLKK
jgi:hypothetical protein